MTDRFAVDRQAMGVLGEAQEFDEGKETTEAEHVGQKVVDVAGELQVDVGVAVRLLEKCSNTVQFSVTPNVNSQCDPRTHDDSPLNVRPELTAVLTFQLTTLSNFDDHEVSDEDHVNDRNDQIERRRKIWRKERRTNERKDSTSKLLCKSIGSNRAVGTRLPVERNSIRIVTETNIWMFGLYKLTWMRTARVRSSIQLKRCKAERFWRRRDKEPRNS